MEKAPASVPDYHRLENRAVYYRETSKIINFQ
jgi:hypothetical protein